jgi:hypothetical protein
MGQNPIQPIRDLPIVSANPGQYFNIIDLSNKITTNWVITIGPCGGQDFPKREPAYIINGKLYPSGSLSNLLPEDIASIQVLKRKEDWKAFQLPDSTYDVIVIKTKGQ